MSDIKPHNPFATIALLVLVATILAGLTACTEDLSGPRPARTERLEAASKSGLDLLPGSRPEIPQPVASLQWRQTKSELLIAVPNLNNESFTPAGYRDISFHPLYTDGRLSGLRVSLKDPSSRDVLFDRWGAPVPRREFGTQRLYWVNEAKGLQVRLESGLPGRTDLIFMEYVPLRDLFEEDVSLPPPLKNVSFGQSSAELEDSVDAYKSGFFVPPGFVAVRFSFQFIEDELRTVRMFIGHGDPGRVMTDAWGVPDRGESLDGVKLFWFHSDHNLRVTLQSGFAEEHRVVYSEYTPALEILGTERRRMGFESTPLLSASVDELRRSYAGYLRESNGGGLSLLFPPTEYATSGTHVWLDLDKEGTVQGYRFPIPFKEFPFARDEIYDLMVAKYRVPERKHRIAPDGHVMQPVLLFNDDPLVTAEEDMVTQTWYITVSRPQPVDAPP